MPAGARTREQFDRNKLVKEIVAEIKKGGPTPEWLQSLAGGLDKRVLAPNTVEVMLNRLKYTPLQFQVSHFTPDAALRVWELSNEDERRQLRPIVATKIARAKTLWPEEKLRLAEQMLRN